MPDLENGAKVLANFGAMLKMEMGFVGEDSLDDLIAYLSDKPELAVISDMAKEVRGGPWAELVAKPTQLSS